MRIFYAQIATIRRTSDGLPGTRWGLRDSDGRPVYLDQPGPWTWTDCNGGQWTHIGRNVDNQLALHLFDLLTDAENWATQHGGVVHTKGPDRMTAFDQSDPIALTEAEQRLGRVARDYTARYERYTNKAGVPVRRLVLVGPEEVDNAAVQAAA
ncbi:hypothetical protein ABT369_28375 [Dactylosporangium sp. NPDC000244]|uniref:hypothetical protein n=1 Tax=Dactylosporangium sp. NPDC000244 TaxID=3154365 RepID=UPI00332A59C7